MADVVEQAFQPATDSRLESLPHSHFFKDQQQMRARVRGHDNRLVAGLTGSIACGKTAVSDMLAALGAYLIDFDLLARQVVEPGAPTLARITGYFGQQILQADGSLDRKKLSKIVFQSPEKRKKLEEFTHPAIFEAFFSMISRITRADPHAIIIAAIPLLIEMNLQFLFDTLIVVHVPLEVQLTRLAGRDGISLQEAGNMIQSQLRPEDKIPYADFVVDNAGSLAATRRQVAVVWEGLIKIANAAG